MSGKRTPIRYWLGGDPCHYEDTDDEVVYILDRVSVTWETYFEEFEVTGVIVGVKYDAAGFIDQIELAESNDLDDCAWVPNDGIFYKPEDDAHED